MKYLVFAFDTEDYVHEYAADGVLRDAKLLTELGIRGSFNVVGRMAKALIKWGRQDVIDALKKHEINTHSLAHTFHPTINEYTDIADYGAALAVLCGEDIVTLTPRSAQIDLDQLPLLRDQDLKEEGDGEFCLKDEYISFRQRLQSWTIRLPAGTERKIFN